MTQGQLFDTFRDWNERHPDPKDAIYGYIVYSADNWSDEYSLEERTYKICSYNYKFMFGSSFKSYYGCCLNGDHINVRLDHFPYWRIEECYILA